MRRKKKLQQPILPQLMPPLQDVPADLRVQRQARLCAKFDADSIAEFRVADREDMGMRVLDDCAEEHIM